eukprot:Gregarina_sp_Pseudo_9__3709@NODE_385_length_2977_cov_40_988428_g363_i0_p2_GENE_NODE_385_length_2977_cov_40_988428_g363_i0NODE_385_length_2977_cov_40_988428_g363_i0_p2_ORF_typecomplete_len426_score73_75PP2/PF14299_6/0_0099_NODE_385_length_2977_cov_40_988428_g363_i0341311
MLNHLPSAAWTEILARLAVQDWVKVFNSGLVFALVKDDQFWEMLYQKRLAWHAPEAEALKNAYDGSLMGLGDAAPPASSESCMSFRERYFDLIRASRRGTRFQFSSVLRGVYDVCVSYSAGLAPRGMVKVELIYNGRCRWLWYIRKTDFDETETAAGDETAAEDETAAGDETEQETTGVAPEALHMTQAGRVKVTCSPECTVSLRLREGLSPVANVKVQSGELSGANGERLLSACACWGAWIDHREIWSPVILPTSPFGQAMYLHGCSWIDIFCFFNRVPGGQTYRLRWKVSNCINRGVFCKVKIFAHDPQRPKAIMAPVGYSPCLEVHNEWQAWKDWYAKGKSSATPQFLSLRREHGDPEPEERPLQTLAFADWGSDGILGDIQVPSDSATDSFDILVSFSAPPQIYGWNYVVDYFALKALPPT